MEISNLITNSKYFQKMAKQKLTERQENQVQYLSKILAAIQDGCFDEDSPNHINIHEFDDEDNLTDFIHVLANGVPNHIFQKLTGQNMSNLDFNHLANKLCFQNSTLDQ